MGRYDIRVFRTILNEIPPKLEASFGGGLFLGL